MDDKTHLFRIDPAASASYNIYKASNKNGGTFLDFLLKYNSKKANEGDFSSVLGQNGKEISSLLTNSAVSASTVSSALQNLNQISSLNGLNFPNSNLAILQNLNTDSDDILPNLLSDTSANSTYDLLMSRADELIKKALNSKNLTSEQKQQIATKYNELTKDKSQ